MTELSGTCYGKLSRLAKVNADVPPQTYYSQVLYCRDKWLPPFMEEWITLIRNFRPERLEV